MKIMKSKKKYFVKAKSNRTLGVHKTKKKALKQVRAIMVNIEDKDAKVVASILKGKDLTGGLLG